MDRQAIDSAVLLAAGLGTRMRPLTDTQPKPLVEVGGMPLLNRVVDNALAGGIVRFAVNVHYKANQMEAAVAQLQQAHPEAEFFISDERDALLDTGGGARKAAHLLGADPVFVMNTDAFWPHGADLPFQRMAALGAERPDAIILLCAAAERSLGFDRPHDFFMREDSVLNLHEGRPMIFAGLSLVPLSCLDAGPSGAWSVLERFHEAAFEDRLLGVTLDAPWLHVGDPKALAEAERFLEQGG